MDEKVNAPTQPELVHKSPETLEEAAELFRSLTLLIAGYRVALMAQGFEYSDATAFAHDFQQHLLMLQAGRSASDFIHGKAVPGQYL